MASLISIPIAVRSRPHRLSLVIAAVTGLSLLDLALTVGMMQTTGMYESNPIAVLLAQYGAWAIVLFKFVCTGLSAGCLWANRRKAAGEIGAWACLICMIALTLHWGQVLEVTAADGFSWDRGLSDAGGQWVCLGAAHR